MTQALEELELAVKHCPDIFAALEKVTGQSFDVILADLDQGPEAGFLLKTAHELKLNQKAFAFAVASGTAYASPQEFGVEVVLAKPIIPDQVKYALLSCDSFLACMQTWSTRGGSVAKKQGSAPAEQSRPVSPPPSPTPNRPPVRPVEPSPAINQGSAKWPTATKVAPPSPNPAPARAPLPTTNTPAPSRNAQAQPKDRVVRGKVLWSTTLGLSILAFGYGASQALPGLKVFARSADIVEETHDRTSEAQQSGSNAPEGIKPADTELSGQAATFPPSRLRAAAPPSPRMVPAHRSPLLQQVSLAATEINATKSDPGPAQPAGAAKIQIPDSIRHPQPEGEPARSTPARLPSLMGQLEPVVLSEEVAEQLLSLKVQPNYPQQAVKAGMQGAVVLQAWIAADGSIRELKLVRGSLLLGQAAYEAVKQWRYKPYLLNGKAVEAQTFVRVNFRLPQQSVLLPSR